MKSNKKGSRELYDEVTKVKCKCGHVQCIPANFKNFYCSWCGNMLFVSKKAEFDYKIKRRFANDS